MPAPLCSRGEHGLEGLCTDGRCGRSTRSTVAPAANPLPLLQWEIEGTSKLRRGAHRCAELPRTAGGQRSSPGKGQGSPFPCQDKVGGFLCSPHPCQLGGEELSVIAKQLLGEPCVRPMGTQGRGSRVGWHTKQLEQRGVGTVPPPRVGPGRRADAPQSHLHVQDRPALLTARCPASPAGSAPRPVSWRCRGPCLHAGRGCSADLKGEKAPAQQATRLPAPAKPAPAGRTLPSSPPPPRVSPSGMGMLGRSLTSSTEAGGRQLGKTSPWDPLPQQFQCPAFCRGAGADAGAAPGVAFSTELGPADRP